MRSEMTRLPKLEHGREIAFAPSGTYKQKHSVGKSISTPFFQNSEYIRPPICREPAQGPVEALRRGTFTLAAGQRHKVGRGRIVRGGRRCLAQVANVSWVDRHLRLLCVSRYRALLPEVRYRQPVRLIARPTPIEAPRPRSYVPDFNSAQPAAPISAASRSEGSIYHFTMRHMCR